MIKWEEAGPNSLWLVTPAEFEKLPDGMVFESIGGKFYTKGKDYIDQDVRGGHLAFGVRNPFNGEYKDYFLLLAIAR